MVAPALARDGVNTFGLAGFSSGFPMHTARPFVRNRVVTRHITARAANVRNDLHFRHALPIMIWPYSSFVGTTTMDVPPIQSEGPSNPPIFVMSQLPNRVLERPPETPPDYGYVAGCRAIPNGYHCDMPHEGVAVSPGG